MSYSIRNCCTKICCSNMRRKKMIMYYWMTPKVDILAIHHDLQQLQQKIPHTLVNVRRSIRLSRPLEKISPSLYSILLIDASELECYDEVVQVDTKIQWESAMKEEMDSLLKNKTWDLCKLLACERALQNKWVYRLKE